MDLRVTLVAVLAVLATLGSAKEATYTLVLSDENLFTPCPEAAPGTLDVHGFLDLSEFSTSLGEHGVLISGNQTLLWDIQPKDRVKLIIKLLYFDRGTWTPTFFSLTSLDFCKSMYDSRQPWYSAWTGHFANFEDVRDKCLNRGTKLILEDYLMSADLNMSIRREGLYKLQISFHAFDSEGNERPTSICFDSVGNLQRKDT